MIVLQSVMKVVIETGKILMCNMLFTYYSMELYTGTTALMLLCFMYN